MDESPAKDEQVSTAPVMRLSTQPASSDSGQKSKKSEGSSLKRKWSGVSIGDDFPLAQPFEDDDGASKSQRSALTSTAVNKKSKQHAKNEADQRQAERNVANLDVNLVLSGKKLGATLRHAKEEAKKMEMKPKLTLGAHTTLVGHALAFAPQNIKGSTKAQIQEAFDVLLQDGRKMSWPLEL